MDQIILNIIIAFLALIIGTITGYYIRQNLAKKRAGSLEAKLQKRVIDVKEETSTMVTDFPDEYRVSSTFSPRIL